MSIKLKQYHALRRVFPSMKPAIAWKCAGALPAEAMAIIEKMAAK